MADQPITHCKHGIPLWAASGCVECKAEQEALRVENEKLKQENSRLRGQLNTARTYPGQT
jgi:hypothetical protein